MFCGCSYHMKYCSTCTHTHLCTHLALNLLNSSFFNKQLFAPNRAWQSLTAEPPAHIIFIGLCRDDEKVFCSVRLCSFDFLHQCFFTATIVEHQQPEIFFNSLTRGCSHKLPTYAITCCWVAHLCVTPCEPPSKHILFYAISTCLTH